MQCDLWNSWASDSLEPPCPPWRMRGGAWDNRQAPHAKGGPPRPVTPEAVHSCKRSKGIQGKANQRELRVKCSRWQVHPEFNESEELNVKYKYYVAHINYMMCFVLSIFNVLPHWATVLQQRWGCRCNEVLRISLKEESRETPVQRLIPSHRTSLPIKQGTDPIICMQAVLRLVWGWALHVG